MYIFYFALVMLAPAAMLIVGLMWKISPPPYQSNGLAYSTGLVHSPPPLLQAVDSYRDYQWRSQRCFDGPL